MTKQQIENYREAKIERMHQPLYGYTQNAKTSVYIDLELVDYEQSLYKTVYEKASENFRKTMPAELTYEKAVQRILDFINEHWEQVYQVKEYIKYRNSITYETRRKRP